MQTSDGSIVVTYPVGANPEDIVFDGANIWVSNYDDNTVTKLRASDGSPLGTFSAGGALAGPGGLAFDGANIWVANNKSSTVSELANDGTLLGTFNVGLAPNSVADGANIWVSVYPGVTELRASDGQTWAIFSVSAVSVAPTGSHSTA
jgi:hypothetical protein